jgi:predicted nuclease with TOPRIM domain
MAENATASNEATMPAFIRAGMDFFTGKTVLKATYDTLAERYTAAENRIKELEAAAIDPKPLNDRITALENDVKTRDETIKTQKGEIARLESEFKSAARQAQEQITRAGANAPVTTDAPKNQEGAKDEAVQFVEKVAAKVTGGLSKSNAIAACVREFPALHIAFIKSGKTLS